MRSVSWFGWNSHSFPATSGGGCGRSGDGGVSRYVSDRSISLHGAGAGDQAAVVGGGAGVVQDERDDDLGVLRRAQAMKLLLNRCGL